LDDSKVTIGRYLLLKVSMAVVKSIISKSDDYLRLMTPRLEEALEDSPVVLIHGPRQCGKTTLARMLGDVRGYAYFSFDDHITRAAAQLDPTGFVYGLPERVIFDEVQHVPEFFNTLKMVVDENRVPGRFLMTGSANVLLLPKLSDSLAGRMQILRLHPLAQCELTRNEPHFLDALFGDGFKVRRTQRLGVELHKRMVDGGYPTALRRPSERRRMAWYRDYVDALIQRDVQDLTRISALDVLARLLAVTASQTSRLLNVSDLASPFQLSRPTIRDYMTLLERIFVLERIPPWHDNRLKRLIKTPKLHLCDTGVACALLGLDSKSLAADRDLMGQLLETFVYQELRRQASGGEVPLTFYHYRDKDQVEVDIVIERGHRALVGIEVKASATVTPSDFRGLHKLKESVKDRFIGGVVLYDGEMSASFGDKMYAVPLRMLWEDS
jgi:uncharacterized protein